MRYRFAMHSPISFFVLIPALILAGGAAVMVYELLTSREGFEGPNGFEFGRESAPAPKPVKRDAEIHAVTTGHNLMAS